MIPGSPDRVPDETPEQRPPLPPAGGAARDPAVEPPVFAPYPPMAPVYVAGSGTVVPGGPGIPTPGPFAPAAPFTPWYDGLRPAAGELAALLRVAGLLAVAGLPLGVLWWLVAPRREYLVAEEGAFAVAPESEAAVGSDGWFLLLTGLLSLLAAFLAWRRLRHRGPLVPAALVAGLLVCGFVTWGVGSMLGPGPSATDLTEIGATVLGPLGLRARGVLLVAPFLAVIGYLLGVCFTPRDDLARADRPSVGRARHAQLDQRDGDGA